jgi:hypothetical protein
MVHTYNPSTKEVSYLGSLKQTNKQINKRSDLSLNSKPVKPNRLLTSKISENSNAIFI